MIPNSTGTGGKKLRARDFKLHLLPFFGNDEKSDKFK